MRDDVANILVVYIAAHIGRESRPHVLDLGKDCKIARLRLLPVLYNHLPTPPFLPGPSPTHFFLGEAVTLCGKQLLQAAER